MNDFISDVYKSTIYYFVEQAVINELYFRLFTYYVIDLCEMFSLRDSMTSWFSVNLILFCFITNLVEKANQIDICEEINIRNKKYDDVIPSKPVSLTLSKTFRVITNISPLFLINEHQAQLFEIEIKEKLSHSTILFFLIRQSKDCIKSRWNDRPLEIYRRVTARFARNGKSPFFQQLLNEKA